jgi:heterokaryon incompatibility protein (HET)
MLSFENHLLRIGAVAICPCVQMRLLNTKTIKLVTFNDERRIPEYAILSHTWGDEEVTFQDLAELSPQQLILKEGYQKVEKSCSMALELGLEWVWVDTCCINQSSSAELSEAINSMYQWYRQSSVCYAYLCDVYSVEEDFLPDTMVDQEEYLRRFSFNKAHWFTRGWCLQELLAPRNMQFYNARWEFIGSKFSLKKSISRVTGIDEYGLFIPDLSVLSIAHRMSWAAGRQTSRPEDIAYCLLGIFNINMPLLYGEGQRRAFIRLQEEIMRRTEDHSIFAWSGKDTDFGNDMVGLLAPHPSAFSYGKIDLCELPEWVAPLSITGRGIQAYLPLIRQDAPGENYLAVIGCYKPGESKSYYAIPVTPLKKLGDIYRRRSSELQTVSFTEAANATLKTIFLLRQSKPTHLEDKDTIQVWFSLLEMRDCIYRIKGAYPASRWNLGRRVFAFSPSDWEQHLGLLSAAVAFANAKGRGFVLMINLDLSRALSTLGLVEFEDLNYNGSPHFDLEKQLSILSTNRTHHHSTSQLDLGQHRVSACVERNTVFEQELYEVRITIK